MKKITLISIMLLICLSTIFSQTNEIGKKYIYEFRDGTTIIGTFVKTESGNIYINDDNGEEVYIPKVMIAQTHQVTADNLRDGEYWFPNLHDTRYFFSPTAYGLKEGEGYFNNVYYLLWQFQWGVTDELSIGGGTSFLGMPATLNMKYAYNVANNVNMATGYFWIGNLFWPGEDRTLVSLPYTVMTFGSKESNFTFGAGYNTSDTWSDGNNLTLNFGATLRAARRFSFIAEAWIFSISEGNILGGPGIRYFRKLNRVTARNGAGAKAFDFQLLLSPDSDGIIPMFGASQKF